jgi:hypothetical protein
MKESGLKLNGEERANMSIYHLHIPRTSGTLVRQEIVNTFNDRFSGHREKLPESFSRFKYVSGHYATNPIKDLDENFAIVRDPVSLTFSRINYMRQGFYPEMSFDEVFNMYLENGKINNFVNTNIKFLTGTVNRELYNNMVPDVKEMAESGWYVENYSTDAAEAIEIVEANKTKIFEYNSPNIHRALSEMYKKHFIPKVLNDSIYQDRPGLEKHREAVENLNYLDLQFFNLLEKQ